jgi:Tfp pilus assembly protein PilX
MNKVLFLKKTFHAGNERGAILIVGLLVILVLTVLTMAAMISTGTELRIAANDRSAKEAFYIGEAGLEDARSRLQVGASASPIYDNQLTNPNWAAFIGTPAEAIAKGYSSGNSNQALYATLNSFLDYVVTIKHKLNSSGNILKWGDSNYDGSAEENATTGSPIYVITSEGHTSTGAIKPVQIEAAQVPPVTAPAALYTKEVTTIQGTSTNVLGMDGCGTSNVPGIITKATVSQNGHPAITGQNPAAIVEHSSIDIDVQKMIGEFKTKADYSYNVTSATLTGMDWGNPTPGGTQQCATSCSQHNIVYFNTNNTYVKLTGQSSGCGMLMVEGDLEVHGGFQWYGVVLVTGSIIFTGGGGKNVTGAVLVGANASADLVGGDANIVYCSKAVNDQTNYLPLVTLRWAELFG